ncbi:uncharacterized protein [Onthophagus taurus]|uniref:uncharacterized protein n=1 Tax=Onthophagus taurus TaxID=166361 RepID=UPI0039BEA8E9
MLRSWMDDNKNTDWVIGCRFVQSSKHRIIGRSPYTALFGTEPKIGLNSTNIPQAILKKVFSEEDLEKLRNDEYKGKVGENQDENQFSNVQELCFICSGYLNETPFVSCSSCSMKIHKTCFQNVCSISDENDMEYQCDICNRQENISSQRQKAHEGHKRAAEKIIENNGKNLKSVTVGNFVLLNVPKVDRGPLDAPNLIRKILKINNDVYQIGTKSGIIKTWFSRSDFQISGAQFVEDIPEEYISIRQAVANESMFGVCPLCL